MRKWVIAAVALLVLVGIGAVTVWYLLETRVRIESYDKPQRVESAPGIDDGETVLVTTIGVPLETLRRALETDVPRRLWAVDRQMDTCVPQKNIKVLGQKLGKTPKVKCRVTGQVDRGRISLVGKGNRLVARIPVNATVTARDIGGVIKQETATGSAVMELSVRLSVGRDWRAQSDLDLDYRWTNEPGIDILGQRVTFTKPADRELQQVMRGVERALNREIGRIAIKPRVEQLWTQGFATLSLSRENPPVWLTIAPQEAGVGSFRVRGKELVTDVFVMAHTRVYVGARPADPERRKLPRNSGVEQGGGFAATVPVMADYAQLEPVILRALGNLAEKGIEREDLGRVEIDFESVEVFATGGGRIAVGIQAEAEPVGKRTGRSWGRSKGEVWLTGKPVTVAGSELVRIEDLRIFGDMDLMTGDALVRIIQMEEIRSAIEAALVEDFQADYARIVEQVRAGLADVDAGDMRLSFTLDSIEHGKIGVYGSGLYMPVQAQGSVTADVRVR
ncbi:DUF4403 family protein [Parerythrobacter aestuarii]|uniref:DUF4403 family protein n=1 Tax=Parerythrobacter aestuarii TaxID=3020909 RepID=UPI0024DE37C9|nr:DUF4403 family protein [Parerythrobacter aestuarii]